MNLLTTWNGYALSPYDFSNFHFTTTVVVGGEQKVSIDNLNRERELRVTYLVPPGISHRVGYYVHRKLTPWATYDPKEPEAWTQALGEYMMDQGHDLMKKRVYDAFQNSPRSVYGRSRVQNIERRTLLIATEEFRETYINTMDISAVNSLIWDLWKDKE